MTLSSLSPFSLSPDLPSSCFAFLWIFFILARWFWNHTWTTRTLKPVSLARASRTFRHGFGLTSNDALNCLLCADVRIVLGLFGPLLPSLGRLFSSNRSSSPELACCIRYISFSKSCRQNNWPARSTNCSPFCNGWQQTTQTKQGKWKTCCWARITISWGNTRSPQREHFTANILCDKKIPLLIVFITIQHERILLNNAVCRKASFCMRPNFVHRDVRVFQGAEAHPIKTIWKGVRSQEEEREKKIHCYASSHSIVLWCFVFYMFVLCFICVISVVTNKKTNLLVVVGFAVQFRISSVAGIVEHDTTDAAGKAVLVPTRVRYSHQISIVDFSAATLANFVGLLAFY